MRKKTVILLFLLATVFTTATYPQDQATSVTQAPKPLPMRIRVGGDVQASALVQRVAPEYPAIAKAAGVSGTVVVRVVVARDGTVEQADIVSGPPMLLKSAIDAVKQWRYKPYLLNGQPVEVETKVSVDYSLEGSTPDPEPPQETLSIDPQFRADIIHLLDIIHFRDVATKGVQISFDSGRSTISNSLPDIPDREKIVDTLRVKMMEMIQSQDFTDAVVGVYAKYLSDGDVKSLTIFYESPAGQHFKAVEIDMSTALGRATEQLGLERAVGIYQQLCTDYPELKGKAKFCQ